MILTLRKTLTQNFEPIIRSVFAEDNDFLLTYNSNIPTGLNLAAEDYMGAIKPGDLFFKIENQYSALVGFFTFGLPMNTMSFYIRKMPYRSAGYIEAFWQLVNETFNNQFFTSLGSGNLTSIPEILVNTFEIINAGEYHAKNFVLLKRDL